MGQLLKAILPAMLHRPARRARARLRFAALFAPLWLRDRALARRPRRRHGLPGPLIVSLTSHALRFASLHRTLACLLGQTVTPDRIVLWLGPGAAARLPRRVRSLVSRGLEIREAEDLGPHTKLLPALVAFPDAFVVNADDDVYYPLDWLEGLAGAHDEAAPAVLCYRAQRLEFAPGGAIAPFTQWQHDVQDAAARRPSVDLLPTGVGGTLYPPASLHPDVLDTGLLKHICPINDDFWFWWQARRAGTRHRKVGGRFFYLDWPGSQGVALHPLNLAGGYDDQVRALVAHYGLPSGLAEAPVSRASMGRGG